ncbi:MAG: hypothetical protein NT027_20445, partial [Proteobacteria bacterium]|nr:hypothetical protein [Pseudomonadota bacterium]
LLLASLENAKSLTIQPNEDPAFFENIRGPSSLVLFSSFIEKIWGGSQSQDSKIDNIENGLAKQLYDLSGHLFVENRKNFDTYFNQNAESSDGPMFSSVGNAYLNEVESTLFDNGGNSIYGCKRQRTRYPGSRWFAVFVNGTKMYADCYGFEATEILKNNGGHSNRIYMESDWQGVVKELSVVKDFFSDLEALRFALRHATMQLYDSFQSKRVVSSITTGGIRRNQDTLLTGCNSVSITLEGLKNAGSINMSLLKDGYRSFTQSKPTALNFLSQLKKFSSQGSYGVDVSYYYETYYQRQYSLKEALPFVKGVHALKNIDCGN